MSDSLISQDIAGIFSFWQAGAICQVFETVAEMRQGGFNPALVFVAAQGGALDMDAADFDWLQNQRVITLDLGETALFPHWQHLARPFTQAQVIQAAYRLMEGDRIEADQPQAC